MIILIIKSKENLFSNRNQFKQYRTKMDNKNSIIMIKKFQKKKKKQKKLIIRNIKQMQLINNKIQKIH